ncbi:MAG TPA: hypothetical protein VFQ78_03655 [Candidatus Udaeobacter sp.]|nr:hypothetical protein [Candidatus Udaeobacter sp.]
MKRQNYHLRGLLLVLFACFAFAGSQISSFEASAAIAPTGVSSKNAGHLTIRRAPKFGTRVRLNVSVDGAQIASLGEGESYNGALAAGKHVISVNVTPGRGRSGTATKQVTVEAGQNYKFTATWSGDRVVLM